MSTIYLLSRSSGYRVGMIARGAAEACAQHGLSLTWQEINGTPAKRLPGARAILFWGRNEDFPQVAALAQRSNVAVISTIGHTLGSGVTTVVPDPVQISEIVADHLHSEELASFAYVGPRHNASERRKRSFFARLHQLEPKAPLGAFFFGDQQRFWSHHSPEGRGFLRVIHALPRPVGLFAFSDQAAVSCLGCLASAGLTVPADVAVVGVDDHPLYANMTMPLTTVSIDYRELGRRAVAAAHDVVSFKSLRKRNDVEIFIPGNLIVRASSQFRLGRDPGIAKVIQEMRSRFKEKFPLEEMAAMAGMSRAAFARKFKDTTGRSPGQFFIEIRLRSAQFLISSTTLPIQQVAEETGFSDHPYFTKMFKKLTGHPPLAYRREQRGSR